jgi:hypothetical protein
MNVSGLIVMDLIINYWTYFLEDTLDTYVFILKLKTIIFVIGCKFK